jgi:hypothetical protein
VVFPSPVVMLSIIAVAMAGIAFVATRGQQPVEVTVAHAQPRPSASADPSSAAPTLSPHKPKKIQPEVKRGSVYVEVYNNSGITGLAGQVAAKASGAGWQVVGSDNWYGTIPASTVYYPARLHAQAKLLGKDLGIPRLKPSIAPMRGDRLTVILTRDYS